MAIRIFEFTRIGAEGANVRRAPWNAQQASSSASGTSSAFAPGTRFVTIQTDTDCYIKFGTGSVTPTTSDFKAWQGVDYDFAVNAGDVVGWLAA